MQESNKPTILAPSCWLGWQFSIKISLVGGVSSKKLEAIYRNHTVSKTMLGKAGAGKALQIGNERGSHALRWQQDLKTQQQSSFSGFSSSKDFTHASRKRSILVIPPRAIINKLKVLWHLICCLHLKLHLEVEQHKVKLLPEAASGPALLLPVKVIIFQIKQCSEPSRCMIWPEILNS